MPAYTFRFPAAAGGLPVSIQDAQGAEVATDTLGFAPDVQGPIILTATLASGRYIARASDPKIFAYFESGASLDIDGSLGGSGALAATVYEFECGAGGSVDANGLASVSFDGVPDGFTPGTTLDAEPGLYIAFVSVSFDEPVEPRQVIVGVSRNNASAHWSGPYSILPDSSFSITGRSVEATLTFWLTAERTPVGIDLQAAVDTDVVDPADLVFNYVYMTLTKIA